MRSRASLLEVSLRTQGRPAGGRLRRPPSAGGGKGASLLTSLLPGLRELRTPLAIGFVWLVNAWIIFAEDLPRSRPQSGQIAALWDLGAAVGATIVLSAVAFAAYIIGSFLEINPQGEVAQRTFNAFSLRRPYLLSYNTVRDLIGYIQKLDLDLKKFSEPALENAKDFISATSRRGRDKREKVPGVNLPGGLPDFTTPEQLVVFWQVLPEIPQIATRLQVSNADLFGKYDRLLAEASLRINLALPVAVLLLQLIWQGDLSSDQRTSLTLITLGVIFLMARQGVSRIIMARDVIIQALVSIDDVRSRRIEERTLKDR